MSNKRKRNSKWDDYREKMSNKRTGKHDDRGISSSMDYQYITVQRLSSTVEGKCQKYSRIGALTIIPLDSEPTLSNIKTACKNHFNLQEMECDLLAREKGPSFTDNSMITNWRVLHIRFIPKLEQECDPSREQTRNRALASPMTSEQVRRPLALPAPSKIPASVPLSVMLQIGKLIQLKVDTVTVELKQFDLKSREWLPPFEVKVSLSKEKSASGAFRDGLQPGEKYVLKKFQEEQTKEVEKLIYSIEDHTRKMVPVNPLAQNFAMKFGQTFSYIKVYLGKLNGEFVTLENYLNGTFQKYLNNTGDIFGDRSELKVKAEAFVHYSYVASAKQLMIVDIKGVNYSLCDSEIASSTLMARDDTILFCSGNLSTTAIDVFSSLTEANRDSIKETSKTLILFQMEEDVSPASLNVTGESSSKFKLVVNAYGCFVESDELNEGHKITKCLSTR